MTVDQGARSELGVAQQDSSRQACASVLGNLVPKEVGQGLGVDDWAAKLPEYAGGPMHVYMGELIRALLGISKDVSVARAEIEARGAMPASSAPAGAAGGVVGGAQAMAGASAAQPSEPRAPDASTAGVESATSTASAPSKSMPADTGVGMFEASARMAEGIRRQYDALAKTDRKKATAFIKDKGAVYGLTRKKPTGEAPIDIMRKTIQRMDRQAKDASSTGRAADAERYARQVERTAQQFSERITKALIVKGVAK